VIQSRWSLRIDPRDAIPIWHQIEVGVRRLVAAGTLRPGFAVPSIRDLAQELSVNPATVAKAYQRLVAAGVLSVRRGEGTFVADHPPASNGARTHELTAAAVRYASVALSLGASRTQAVECVKDALTKLKGGKP
jgi:GntR family transcriptional regulator